MRKIKSKSRRIGNLHGLTKTRLRLMDAQREARLNQIGKTFAFSLVDYLTTYVLIAKTKEEFDEAKSNYKAFQLRQERKYRELDRKARGGMTPPTLPINPRIWTKTDKEAVMRLCRNRDKVLIFPAVGDGASETWARMDNGTLKVWFYQGDMMTEFCFKAPF